MLIVFSLLNLRTLPRCHVGGWEWVLLRRVLHSDGNEVDPHRARLPAWLQELSPLGARRPAGPAVTGWASAPGPLRLSPGSWQSPGLSGSLLPPPGHTGTSGSPPHRTRGTSPGPSVCTVSLHQGPLLATHPGSPPMVLHRTQSQDPRLRGSLTYLRHNSLC